MELSKRVEKILTTLKNCEDDNQRKAILLLMLETFEADIKLNFLKKLNKIIK